jgi:hypothetical protein
MEILIALALAQFILVVFGKEKEIIRCLTPTLICIGVLVVDNERIQLTPMFIVLIIFLMFGVQFFATSSGEKDGPL